MALTLHQSGHGHSHGGLSSSHGHGHSHSSKEDKGKGHSHGNSNHAHGDHGDSDVEHQGTKLEPGVKAKAQANASVRSAFVHVMGDLLQSISVLVSAVIIFFKVRGQPWRACRFVCFMRVCLGLCHCANIGLTVILTGVTLL